MVTISEPITWTEAKDGAGGLLLTGTCGQYTVRLRIPPGNHGTKHYEIKQGRLTWKRGTSQLSATELKQRMEAWMRGEAITL